jgi:single-stranded DNA-binding protein
MNCWNIEDANLIT